MKGVSWMTQHAIGDGAVLIVLATFDERVVRVTIRKDEAQLRLAISEISKYIREVRADAKRQEYSALH